MEQQQREIRYQGNYETNQVLLPAVNTTCGVLYEPTFILYPSATFITLIYMFHD